MLGQTKVKEFLRSCTGAPPSCLLLHGQAGIGKRSFAKVFATAVAKPGDIITYRVNEGEKTYRIEDLHELRKDAAFGPSIGPFKCYILEDFHRLLPVHHNFLLKTLEEVREDIIFILLADHLGTIPSTVLSRCFCLKLEPYSDLEITEALEQRGIRPDPALVGEAEGSIGAALRYHTAPYMQCKELLLAGMEAYRNRSYSKLYLLLDRIKELFEENLSESEGLFAYLARFLNVPMAAVTGYELGANIKNFLEYVLLS
ncbi:MAG: hypothetical protein A3F09_02530 [Chlamydiae bacterium RIFCSPHIGHO2_12_FULL_49_11]|nr:MAG: hypothetical protein A3F09_02530 [Chlamydiae bacterium RIFCSPHIGHO2_12_FULL_49_11]